MKSSLPVTAPFCYLKLTFWAYGEFEVNLYKKNFEIWAYFSFIYGCDTFSEYSVQSLRGGRYVMRRLFQRLLLKLSLQSKELGRTQGHQFFARKFVPNTILKAFRRNRAPQSRVLCRIET